MSRVLAAASGAAGPADAERAIAHELGVFTGASTALLVAVDEQSAELQETPAIADALTAELAIRLDGAEARRLTAAVGAGAAPAALLLPLRARNQTYVLVLAGEGVRDLSVEDVEAAAALLAAAGTSLAQ
ncbi:MAG: hypothetical protein QOF65_2925, partial [Thermoleophilaceae bacterium]|nr:hypothetical protein [Thermoleophilaceae bacterium]